MRIKKEHIRCKEYAAWIYWQGAFVGLFIGFGFNIMLSYGTYLGNLNTIFTTIFAYCFIINIILRLRSQTKFALRGN